jgi:hypothetical protein
MLISNRKELIEIAYNLLSISICVRWCICKRAKIPFSLAGDMEENDRDEESDSDNTATMTMTTISQHNFNDDSETLTISIIEVLNFHFPNSHFLTPKSETNKHSEFPHRI